MSAPSQNANEDIELVPIPTQKGPAIADNTVKPSQDDFIPMKPGRIRWALEDFARHKPDSAVHQEQHAKRFPSQHNSAYLRESQENERTSAADTGCSEPHSQNNFHRETDLSDESAEEALRALDSHDTTPAIGKCSTASARRVKESLEISNERRPSVSSFETDQHVEMLPWLSRQVTVGRNSDFRGLSAQDREELGGIEYRSLKILLKILIGKSLASWCDLHLLLSKIFRRTLSRPAYDRRYRSFAVDHTRPFALPRLPDIPRAGQSVVVSGLSHNPDEPFLTVL